MRARQASSSRFRAAAAGDRLRLARFVPSGRSLGIAVLIVLGAAVAWLGARETGVFAVRTVDVAGAPPSVQRQVRRALAPTRGTSLLKVDPQPALRTVEALPTVESARFDRAYPHTLRVVVVPERPVAIVRQGADSYLVAESGWVIATAERRGPAGPRAHLDRSHRDAAGRRTDRRRPADCRGGRCSARRLQLPGARRLCHGHGGRAHAPSSLGARDPTRRRRSTSRSSSPWPPA